MSPSSSVAAAPTVTSSAIMPPAVMAGITASPKTTAIVAGVMASAGIVRMLAVTFAPLV